MILSRGSNEDYYPPPEPISELVLASKNVFVCRESFTQLSSYFEKMAEIFHDFPETLQAVLQSLEPELKNAKELIETCSSQSRFFLLLTCPGYIKRVRDIAKSVEAVLSQILLDHTELSLRTKNKLKDLCREMKSAQMKASNAEEDLVDEIELVVRDRRKSSAYANDLLSKLVKVTGVSSDPSSLKLEFEELIEKKEAVELDKHKTEVFQLEQIISILSCADALSSTSERERRYREERRLLGDHSLPPLRTFYCPITQDVMEQPVEIASGHTFEMSAIQKWFADGHNVCPVSNIELQSLQLKPNRLLQQSIEEWRDRNTMIKVAAMPSRLRSDSEDEITETLLEVQALCDEKPIHRHWIAAEGLIPVLVSLLGSSKRDIRKKTLTTLCSLMEDNEANRAKICDAGAVAYAVRSLARDAGEVRQAVALLLQVSKDETICEQVSKVQGCILLLVTTTNSGNIHASADAKELLRLFSKSNDNVILMAEVNYFKPLIQCLDEGSNMTKIIMANALSRMELTEQSRALLVQEGVLPPLVSLASLGNLEGKSAALGAFRKLSELPENRDPMIEAGVVPPMLELLFTVKSVVMTVREHAAATFANLAMASQVSGIKDLWGDLTDPEEAVFQLLSLLNLAGPSIQCHILRALNCICRHPASISLRETLREGGSIQLLIRFVDAKHLEVRLHALKLMYFLTQDGGGNVLADEMVQESYQVLVDLFSCESLHEEKIAAMGILGNVPINNRRATERMLQTGVFTSIVRILQSSCSRGSGNATNNSLVDNATKVLIRFTLPTDIQLQQHTAKQDTIPLLVSLLNSGTAISKSKAAMCLEQFSESTIKLSVPVKRTRGWFCCASSPTPSCRVHSGLCSVEGTFCLLESGAIPPLIRLLEEAEDETDEAALGALATLVYDECWEKGSDFIVEAQGIMPIVRKLTAGSAEVQEKALWILERIFRKDRYKAQFGNVSQMALVSLTQDGTNATRPLAAKILAHLNILHDQSSYF